MNYYLMALKKYAVFSGRAQRAEYWYFVLFNMLISFAFNLLVIFDVNAIIVLVLSILFMLAIVIPSIAVLVRRLHDTNHSGWWFFINFIPVIGMIVLLVFLVTDSDPAENQYGQNPKGLVVA